MKSRGSATITSYNKPMTPRGRDKRQKVRRNNAYTTNKQIHERHVYQLPLCPSEVITMLNRTENIAKKEQSKTQHKMPQNHKATQNKNNTGTTVISHRVYFY